MQRPIPQVAGDGGRLLGLLRGQRFEGFEKSFKMARGSLLAERVLFGVPRAGADPASLAGVCRALAMPEPYLAAFEGGLAEADTVHFGFEAGEGLLYKVYLEYARRYHGAPRGGPPVVLHHAYKWDASDPRRRAVARYECFPGLPAAGIRARLAALYGHRGAPSQAAACAALDLAGRRSVKPLMYLEVAEEGNPRASFDLNLHPADLRVADLEAGLRELQQRYAIAEDAFEPVWENVRGQALGHVAGGTSRGGGDFFTVYHGVGAP